MKYVLIKIDQYEDGLIYGLSFVESFDSWQDAYNKKNEMIKDRMDKREKIIQHAIKFIESWEKEFPDECSKYFINQLPNIRNKAMILAERCRTNCNDSHSRSYWGMTTDRFKNPHDYSETFSCLDLHIVEIHEEVIK